MKLHAKRSICILLIVALTVLLIPSTSFAATKKLATPKITSVKSINQSYIKISWKKSPGATKYAIYRSIQNKSGTFKKVCTTTKSYYNDKKVIQGKAYFYKVKALSPQKNSNLSEAKKIIFSPEKIILERNFYECGYNVSIAIPYIKNATNSGDIRWRENLKEMGALHFMREHGNYIYTWNENDWKPYDTFGAIELWLSKDKKYKTKVNIRFIGYNNVPSYKNDYDVPDFGVIANKTEDRSSLERKRVYKFGHDCDDSDSYTAYNSYISLLDKWGYRNPKETTKKYEDSYTVTTSMSKTSNHKYTTVDIEKRVFFDNPRTEITIFY